MIIINVENSCAANIFRKIWYITIQMFENKI